MNRFIIVEKKRSAIVSLAKQGEGLPALSLQPFDIRLSVDTGLFLAQFFLESL